MRENWLGIKDSIRPAFGGNPVTRIPKDEEWKQIIEAIRDGSSQQYI